jgi:hypothetical protein
MRTVPVVVAVLAAAFAVLSAGCAAQGVPTGPGNTVTVTVPGQ